MIGYAPRTFDRRPVEKTLDTTVGQFLRIKVALTIRLWAKRHRQRVDLAEMEDYQLRDIGRSRTEARLECAKWFWQK